MNPPGLFVRSMLLMEKALLPVICVDVREWINHQWRRILEQEKRIDESRLILSSRYAELASLYWICVVMTDGGGGGGGV